MIKNWNKKIWQNFLPFIKRDLRFSCVEPQGIERGRTLTRISSVAKYGGAGANFRGRKSNSLMNLCGGKNKNAKHFLSTFVLFARSRAFLSKLSFRTVSFGFEMIYFWH